MMVPLHRQLSISTLRHVIKRLHFPLEIMLVCVRWYAAYPLSLRQLEEMMAERGVSVDHATVHRLALKILPVLASIFRGRVDADRKLTHLKALCRLKTDPGVLLTLPKFWAGEKEGDHHGNVGKNSADVPARQAVAA